MRTRFRTNWRGKLILQVLDTWNGTDDEGRPNVFQYWRDAKLKDFPDAIKFTHA